MACLPEDLRFYIGYGVAIWPYAPDANLGPGINSGHARNLNRQQESNSFDVVYLRSGLAS